MLEKIVSESTGIKKNYFRVIGILVEEVFKFALKYLNLFTMKSENLIKF